MGSSSSHDRAGHPLAVLLPRVRSRLAEDSVAGLGSASDAEIAGLLCETEGLAAQVEALRLSLIEQVRRREVGAADGAAATAAWLAATHRRHPAGCGRDLRLARDLAGLAAKTGEVLAGGTINPDQARVIAAAVAALPAEAGPAVRVEAEAHLLEQAAIFNAKDLAILGRRVLEVVDPELADRVLARQLAADDARAERCRELTLSPDPAGGSGTLLRGKLDAETAEMLERALDPLSKPRPTDADNPDTRTPAQRRGDGFHEMLRRYLASGESPTSHGLPTQLVITVTDRNLLAGTGVAALLHSGTPVSTETARRHACDAQLTLHTEGDGAGAGLSGGARLFTGKLRRLLELRDRGCAFPGCDRPLSWCDAHHIVHWLHGGTTTLHNGVLLCGRHHQLAHHGEWTIKMATDGHPDFVPPDHIDPRRKPLRNTRLRL